MITKKTKSSLLNKRGIITTILIVQLIFLAIITMSTLQVEKEKFTQNTQFKRIASYRLTAVFNNVYFDVAELKSINSSSETLNNYADFVSSLEQYYSVEINITDTHLSVYDRNLQILKAGEI